MRATIGRSAAVGAAAIVALVLTVPGTSASPAGAEVLTTGQVTWGVKGSFLAYVTGPVGGGTVEVLDGATAGPGGAFTFPGGTGTQDGDDLDLAVRGGVRFVAHAGALDLTIDELRVTREGATGALVADVASRSLGAGDVETFDDIVVATLDFAAAAPVVEDGVTTWGSVPAVLTAVGSTAFAAFYPAGTVLDPVTLVVGTEPATSTTGTSTTSTSTTSTSTTSTSTTGTSTTGTSTTGTSTTSTSTTSSTAPPVEASGTATATGIAGQRLTVSPVRDLDPAGERVRVTGEGYDPAVGIYVAFCVDRGPGVAPSPCVGGVDTSGASGSAVWVSSTPPPYGVGLARPFGPGGTFDVEMTVVARAVDDDGSILVDCTDPSTRCVVATRADHTAAGDRRADVAVPVSFVGQSPVDPTPAPTAGPTTGPTTGPGTAAAPAPQGTAPGATRLPATGTTGDLARAGALLLAAGAALLAAARRAAPR